MRHVIVQVDRSEHSKPVIDIGEWEIPMLEYEYEETNRLAVQGFVKVDGREYPDAASELQRLVVKYGKEEGGQDKAILVYGQGQTGVRVLEGLIEESRKREAAGDEEIKRKQLETKTVEQKAKDLEAREAELAKRESALAAAEKKLAAPETLSLKK